jgi:hypothetical protein
MFVTSGYFSSQKKARQFWLAWWKNMYLGKISYPSPHDFGEFGDILICGASSGPCSRGLLLTRQPLYWAELSRQHELNTQITPTHCKLTK